MAPARSTRSSKGVKATNGKKTPKTTKSLNETNNDDQENKTPLSKAQIRDREREKAKAYIGGDLGKTTSKKVVSQNSARKESRPSVQ